MFNITNQVKAMDQESVNGIIQMGKTEGSIVSDPLVHAIFQSSLTLFQKKDDFQEEEFVPVTSVIDQKHFLEGIEIYISKVADEATVTRASEAHKLLLSKKVDKVEYLINPVSPGARPFVSTVAITEEGFLSKATFVTH